ncbi:hypothetical protein BX600DRAFT_203107 [Xylariales sp. PMI_506]|nr:hypothetical protein BX600DRAFT_203107 [Xylariales sp. PMI_506]
MEQKTHYAGAPQMPAQPQPTYQEQAAYGQGAPPMAMIHPTPLNQLGGAPAIIDCPFCNQRVQTRVTENDSSMTIVAGIGIGLFCICLSCLPCMLHWFQDVDHTCSSCNQRVCHIPQGGIPQVVSPPGGVPQQYVMGAPQTYGAPPPQGAPAPPHNPPQYATQ